MIGRRPKRIGRSLPALLGLALALASAAMALPVIGVGSIDDIDSWLDDLSKPSQWVTQLLQALDLAPEAMIAGPLAALGAILAGGAMLRQRPQGAVILCILSSVLFLPALSHLTIPALSRAFLAPKITSAVEKIAKKQDLIAVLRSSKIPCRMILFFPPEMILLFPPEKSLFSRASYGP